MSDPAHVPTGGPISWMARNPVAANLVMFVILVGGLLTMSRVKQEVFPEFELDVVGVSVPYPGASPAEVEQGVVLAVEEAVRGVDGVKRITSTASEGIGNVSVEVLLGEDPDKVLNDVKSAVDRITSFPEDAEKATVALLARRQVVVSLVLSGDLDLATLHAVAEEARLQLLDAPDVSQVDLQGVPPLEVAVEVSRERLEAYGLTLEEVAAQIRQASLELPGGAVETAGGEILVRVADRRRSAAEFAQIPLRGTGKGALVRLGDIATVRDGYADTKQESYYDGRRAVRLVAYRVGDETPRGVSAAVRAHVDRMRASLPPTVSVDVWDDDSEILADRIALLTSNGAMGMVLVLVTLALFLDLRLAFWVGLGIPTSFMGAFLLMPALGLSINMITLFAFIVTLGMVVDDAIVIGENTFEKLQSGVPRLRAAVEGAQEMAVPVTFAILTTVAAFSPLFFVPGVMGKIFRLFPAVVITVLLFSLFESFFVLPAHLGHGEDRAQQELRGVWRLLDLPRAWMSGGLERFTAGPYRRFLEGVLRQRYAAIATGAAAFVVAVGMVVSGLVPASFFPVLEGDVVTAAARLPYGAPVAQTRRVREQLEAAAAEAVAATGGDAMVVGLFTRIGEGPAGGGPAGLAAATGSHLVTVELALVPSGERDVSADAVAAAWSAAMPPLAGVEALTFSAASGPGAGAAVDMLLSHTDQHVLEQASVALTDALRRYGELRNVTNGFAAGKEQFDYTLRPEARTLGLSASEVARQIRASFFGAEALREQRGRNEVRVMVRLPPEQRASQHDLAELRIRTPQGGFVPLAQVADVTPGRAATSIRRRDGVRTINVSADLQPDVPSPRPVLESLERDVYPEVLAAFPGLQISPVGQAESQRESLAALGPNYLVALFVIYAMLAIPFRSYLQPLVVMSAIPFGIIGAIVGHLLLGYELSLISMFGIIALSGVVVNDSLVMIDTVNRFRGDGEDAQPAIVRAATRRIRPILLTSLTTFFGLMPMIFETSMQARFLIPMAVSLGFGILFSTVIVLVLVPALYVVVDDVSWVEDRLNAEFLRMARRVTGSPTLSGHAPPVDGQG